MHGKLVWCFLLIETTSKTKWNNFWVKTILVLWTRGKKAKVDSNYWKLNINIGVVATNANTILMSNNHYISSFFYLNLMVFTLYCFTFLFTFLLQSFLLLKCKKVCFWLSFSPFFFSSIYFLKKSFFTFFFRCLLSHCITLMMMKNGKLQTTSFKLKSISHAIFIFIISIFFSIISAVKLS